MQPSRHLDGVVLHHATLAQTQLEPGERSESRQRPLGESPGDFRHLGCLTLHGSGDDARIENERVRLEDDDVVPVDFERELRKAPYAEPRGPLAVHLIYRQPFIHFDLVADALG